jgi:Spy/CpxP family protein refolding chaperone
MARAFFAAVSALSVFGANSAQAGVTPGLALKTNGKTKRTRSKPQTSPKTELLEKIYAKLETVEAQNTEANRRMERVE